MSAALSNKKPVSDGFGERVPFGLAPALPALLTDCSLLAAWEERIVFSERWARFPNRYCGAMAVLHNVVKCRGCAGSPQKTKYSSTSRPSSTSGIHHKIVRCLPEW